MVVFNSEMAWQYKLKQLVEKKPLIVLRFDSADMYSLMESGELLRTFTVARPRAVFAEIKVPTVCLFQAKDSNGKPGLYIGLVGSKNRISTLDLIARVHRICPLSPNSEKELCELMSTGRHAGSLERKLSSKDVFIVHLTPKLSSYLIDRLASIPENRKSLQSISAELEYSRRFDNAQVMQSDAVRSALQTFGLLPDSVAKSLELVKGRHSILSRIHVKEDTVIEHDARRFPGYDLIGSDVTGRAVFKNRGGERLEIYTANRGDLETAFGVDLIYLNLSKQNIVMVQYKMLDPLLKEDRLTDWIYRLDGDIEKQIVQMQLFTQRFCPASEEFRLNPAMFYLKFVKRNASTKNASILLPLEHFQILKQSDLLYGERNGLRVSYNALSGRYLREHAFCDLVRSGYIGAYSKTTTEITKLIEWVLCGGRSVVAALQST